MFEEAVSPRWSAETAWSLAASFLLHALLALAIAELWSAAPPPVPFEEVIPVDLLFAPEPAALPPADRPGPETIPPATAGPLMHATTILSGKVLAEARNREARQDLAKLNAVERMIQLCNVEALHQVARVRSDFFPEWIDAHATGEIAIGPNTVVADGAAVRSGDDWYALRYRCRLSPGHDAVVAFDFLAGEKFSAARIEELGLAIGD